MAVLGPAARGVQLVRRQRQIMPWVARYTWLGKLQGPRPLEGYDDGDDGVGYDDGDEARRRLSLIALCMRQVL